MASVDSSQESISEHEKRLLGFRNSKSVVKSLFREFLWMTTNLSAEKRQELSVIGSHLVHCIDMLDLESTEGLSLDVWYEIRDEMSDALCDKPANPELAALAYVVAKREIPKQFIFDMFNGVDYWIRFRGFETWEQLDTFASNLGGSAMVASAKLAGVTQPNYENSALACGKAVLMTQKLAGCCIDLKANRNFLAHEDLKRFKLDVHRLKMRRTSTELKQFVRFTVSRLEKVFYDAGKLVDHLELGAARSVTSLLSMHWRILTRLRQEPELILNPSGILGRRDRFALKSRHLLGIEGNIPIFDHRSSHH